MSLIIYIDVDAFAVAVERILNRDLSGRVVVISTQTPDRGLVACASYEARALGVRAGMPLAAARRRVERAVFLGPNPLEYEKASRRLFAFLHDHAPVVEADKMDGFFLDLTGCERWMNCHPTVWASRLARKIYGDVRLPVSFGIASNKMVARMAARVAKPGRAICILPGCEADFISPVSVGLLPGVGKKARQELREFGIRRIGQMVHLGDEPLRRIYGHTTGNALWQRAQGIFHEPVKATPIAETLHYDHLFPGDSSRIDEIEAGAALLAQRLAWKLRDCGARCCSARIDLVYSDGHHCARRLRIFSPSDRDTDLIDAVRRAAGHAFRRRVCVRSVHLTAALHQQDDSQYDLFQEQKQRRTSRLYQAIDEVRAKHGFASILIAGGVASGRDSSPRRLKPKSPAGDSFP